MGGLVATLERDAEIELDIESIGFEGVSVARHDGIVIFVNGALPGERVRARMRSKQKRFWEAETMEVLQPSASRINAPCTHFGICGGCKWQHLSYVDQLHWKRQHVVDAFERIGHIAVGEIHPTVGCERNYGYRNKMEFSFGASAWLTREEIDSEQMFDMSFALGLHVPGRFDKVRNLDYCWIQNEHANALLAKAHTLSREFGIVAYHSRSHAGFARNLVLRTSATTGAIMACLITTTPKSRVEQDFIDAWMQSYDGLPDGSSVLHAINDTWSPVAVGTITQQQGPGYLEETSHDISYRISMFSFFQTNTVQLPQLVGLAIDGALLTGSETVWDLYCGTGTLTLPAARKASKVIGIELSASSIADAHSNAARNDITNVELHALDLHIPAAIRVLKDLPHPDVIIIDPPRAGMHPTLAQHILSVGAKRIVYVSCNPATQARDCALLSERYAVVSARPVDMFPQTYHVECVAVLERLPDNLDR